MLKRDLGTGDLCDNIGLVGVSAKWSYVTASPSHHDQAIPILSPLLFMHVGHPYIPLFNIGFYHFTKFRVSTTSSFLREFPEGVYWCFTRTTLFTTMFIMITLAYSLNSMHIIPRFALIGCYVSELRCSCNVSPEVVYCCFTSIMFTTFFTCYNQQVNQRILKKGNIGIANNRTILIYLSHLLF